MGATVQADEELFGVRPLFAWQRTMGLVPSPVERRIAQRALNVALISWLPLFVFAAATELIFRNGTARSFLTDGAVHTRFLIALLAVPGCHGRSSVVPHFQCNPIVRLPQMGQAHAQEPSRVRSMSKLEKRGTYGIGRNQKDRQTTIL